MASDAAPGSEVAGYRIEREIAAGPAGETSLAYDPLSSGAHRASRICGFGRSGQTIVATAPAPTTLS